MAGSQKGLMLPPGMSFNAVSAKALTASKSARLPRSFWDWNEFLTINKRGYFPYTPNTNLMQAMKVAINLLHEEGLENVFARHERAAEATRRCVQHWGFELQCLVPAQHSPIVTGVRMPEGVSADKLRAEILTRCNMTLGSGLGRLADTMYRIGHTGDFSDVMVTGTLSGIEMGMKALGMSYRPGGVQVAMDYLVTGK